MACNNLVGAGVVQYDLLEGYVTPETGILRGTENLTGLTGHRKKKVMHSQQSTLVIIIAVVVAVVEPNVYYCY